MCASDLSAKSRIRSKADLGNLEAIEINADHVSSNRSIGPCDEMLRRSVLQLISKDCQQDMPQ